jgi:hypothetical protein
VNLPNQKIKATKIEVGGATLDPMLIQQSSTARLQPPPAENPFSDPEVFVSAQG